LVTDVVLPQGGLEVSEGTVVTVDVAVGDRVAEGDRLLEVETDKAMSDVVAPRDGLVVSVEVEVGDTVEVGATLVRLGDGNDDLPEETESTEPSEAPEAEPVLAGVAASPPVAATAVASDLERRGAHHIRAAPIARRAAAHLGVALEQVTGTGPRGRITLRDVQRAAQEGAAKAGEDEAAAEHVEAMSATRRVIARRMTSSQQIPQFALHRDVDVTWLLAEKDRLSAEGPAKVGVNELLVQALAETVVRHQDLAASYVPPEDGGQPGLLRREGVNIGLAVATDRGLLVPVIRRAHERTLAELALDRARLVEEARAGRLDRADMTGATISLSSLAAFGIDRFNAMLNPGESAILAVGRTVDRVVPRDRGFVVLPTLTLTMTVDHRVVDGAAGARALMELVQLLEGGMAWRV
jgi:pyruvate dehydrogenase E2 component (dihydrolipoamide acetyltransferase)